MSVDDPSPAARTARLAKLQYEEGVDLFATNWSSFHRVAQSGDIRGLRMFLLEAKVNVDTVNAQGDTALNLAAFAGQQHVVDELLKHGADSRPNNKVAALLLLKFIELRHHQRTCLLLALFLLCASSGLEPSALSCLERLRKHTAIAAQWRR
jgi:ankyrin repeat protein